MHLGERAHHAIGQINATAAQLRHELLADIPAPELRLCMQVLERIRNKAERADKNSKSKRRTPRLSLVSNGQGGNGQTGANGRRARQKG